MNTENFERTRISGWTLIAFVFVGLFTLALSHALAEEPAAAITLKNLQEITNPDDLPIVLSGLDGGQGPMGPIGSQGTRGLTGATGAQGLQGARGETGTQGLQGAQGETGAQGLQGAQGETGTQGAQGIPGTQGPRGDIGPMGPVGPAGAQGAAGNIDLPLQKICVDKKFTLYWGSCDQTGVKGTDYQIYIPR